MKNAGDRKESYISSTNGTSDSSCSIESMEAANTELDAEPTAARVLIQADDSIEKGESAYTIIQLTGLGWAVLKMSTYSNNERGL